MSMRKDDDESLLWNIEAPHIANEDLNPNSTNDEKPNSTNDEVRCPHPIVHP